MKRTLKLFVAIVATIGFTFAGCQAPAGPQGEQGLPGGDLGDYGPEWPAPELEVQLDGEELTELILFLGDSRTLVPKVSEGAVVQMVLWELYDDAAGEIIRLSREPSSRFPMLTGGNVVVTGIADGEARLRVTALGSGDAPVQKTISITVEGIARRLAALADRVDDLSGPEVFYLHGSERIAPQLLSFEGTSVNVVLKSNRPDIILYLDGLGPIFTVGGGVALTLEGFTLQGRSSATANNNALVRVNTGGFLEMREGARIVGNLNPTPAATAATQGGGVHVAAGGTFTMYDGEISGHLAVGHGSGVFNLGIFNMHGGKITDNATASMTTINTGGGVHNRGTFNMHSGRIFGNSVNAFLASNAVGGGVANTSTFNMFGGEIFDNEAGQGGGVVNTSSFTMHDGAIFDNTAISFNPETPHQAFGGGVLNIAGTFSMLGGEIFGNVASGNGGGVLNEGEGVFQMHGGEISDNTATNGAGVENLGTFNMSGGVIHGIDYTEDGNTATSSFATLRTSANAISQFGAFDPIFAPGGDLPNTDLTLRVTAGDLVIPDMGGSLAMQLAWLRTFAQGDSYTIVLSGSETIAPTLSDSGPAQALPTGRELTISIEGSAPSEISISGNGNAFRVPAGITLILDDDITLRGRSGNIVHLVRVNNGGTFIMNAGSRVTGNINTSLTGGNGGGGVFVNNGGTFILNGGTIANNETTNIAADGGHGAGVRVHSGGRFIMLGGEIYGNRSSRDGGGVFVTGGANQGVFQISGGTIYGSSAAVEYDRRNRSNGFGASLNSGAGIARYGTFEQAFDGTTVESLGEFEGRGTLRISNTTIVVVDGDFEGMDTQPIDASLVDLFDWLLDAAEDGETYHFPVNSVNEYVPHVPFPNSRLPIGLSNITVYLYSPGGPREVRLPREGTVPALQGILFSIPSGVTLVLGENVTLVGRSGAIPPLQNNNALVRVNSGGTLIMNSGSRITGNIVNSTQTQNAAGAGVWVNSGGTFIMNGGEISDNVTGGSGTSLNGAGVRVESGGRFYMNGGVILDNEIRPAGTTSQGGGVWVASGGIFRMGAGTIYGIDAEWVRDDESAVGNVASNGGASLFAAAGSLVEFGTFNGAVSTDNFVKTGDLRTSNLTVYVDADGLQPPARVGSLATQLTWLREFAGDGMVGGIAEYTITLSGDETILPSTADTGTGQLLPTDRSLTIIIEGDEPSTIRASANGNLFRVPSGITLILDDNVTLEGRGGNSNHLVRVTNGGIFRMNAGSAITGNTNSHTGVNGGGGVNVATGGRFILDGGTISGNTTTATTDLGNGGGVRVESGGTFDMLGGTVSDNESQFGGGVFVASGGTFQISDGTIYGNGATVTRNVSRGELGASLKNLGVAQFGTFIGYVFSRMGDLGTNNLTIAVTNGSFALQPEPPAEATLAERLDWLRAFGQEQNVTISLHRNETLSPAQALLPAGRNITITGGYSINISANDGSLFDSGSLFSITPGTTLILENVTLVGRNASTHAANNHGPLVVVDGGTLRMYAGSKITGNTNTLVPGLPAWWLGGGGVHVTNSGTFNMYGGEISGNATTGAMLGGAGVHIADGGTFTMRDGEISGNEAGNAGVTGLGAGGVRVAGTFVDGVANMGTFNMYGGRIYGNSTIAAAAQNGGGVLVAAMGVFNMRGGEISGNVARGNNSAGGVFVAFDSNSPRRVAGVFNMYDGTISGNSATAFTTQTAGGVRVNGSSDGTIPIFNMRGGIISGNRAYSTATNAAGGVNVLGGSFFRISDGIIHGSDAGALANYATTGPHALFRTTAATGAQFGTFDGTGAFTRGGDLLNEERTIEVRGGELQPWL